MNSTVNEVHDTKKNDIGFKKYDGTLSYLGKEVSDSLCRTLFKLGREFIKRGKTK